MHTSPSPSPSAAPRGAVQRAAPVRRRQRRPRHGIFMADISIAVAVVAVMAVALVMTMAKQRQAARQSADLRAAARLAETALSDLQSGQNAPPAGAANDGNDKVSVRPLSGGTAQRRGWIEVTATVNGRSVSLRGLVPSEAVGSTTAPARGAASTRSSSSTPSAPSTPAHSAGKDGR